MRTASRVLAAAISLLVTACYSSRTPLITSANADYPFGASTEFRLGTMEGARGVLARIGDHYEKQYPNAEPTLLQFHQIEGDFYAVQELSDQTGAYTFDLARIEDDAVFIYGIRCERDEDQGAVASSILESVDDGSGMLTCWVNDFERFKQHLAARAEGAAPLEGTTYLIVSETP